jgi:DNA-directed RNA polymerase subunit H (RpoH/RPB5)
MDDFYLLWSIYQNVEKFLTDPKYRGLKLTNTFTREDFQRLMNENHYIIMIANTEMRPIETGGRILKPSRSKAAAMVERSMGKINYALPRTNRLIVILTDILIDVQQDIKHVARNKAAFVDVMENLPPAEEIIVLSDKPVSTYVAAAIELYKKKLSIVIHNFLHRVFLIEMPLAAMVPKHTIVRGDELQQVLHDFHGDVTRQPRIIAFTDPQTIWLGANPGDIIRIDRESEIGHSVEFRYAI